jgi:NADPH2:quinone reductase
MRALVVEELLPDYAGCVVKEIPTPEPGPGEVRIKVRAAAVNFPDLMQTRGEHQHKPAVPFVGGLELAAVDYAKLHGCKVIAASASDEKLAVIEKEYAPDATVNVTGGFRERVKEITGGRGADVIYDPVGGDVFDESLRCIAFGGRILSIGFTSGRLPVLPVNIALIKGFSVMGVRAGEFGRQFPAKGRENNEAIWNLAEAGLVKPRVDKEYALADWRAAFDSLADRKVIGKTIIRPDL